MEIPYSSGMGPLGIFDSGFGGLDIARGIRDEFPDLDIAYLGDTAQAPYGTRSQELIHTFTRQCVDFLMENGSPLVILACNTASSDALRELQKHFIPNQFPDRNILGVLIPAVQEAVQTTRNERIGVLATPATVRSRAFERETNKINPNISVFQRACPLLVPLVEAGEHNSPIARAIVKYSLGSFVRETGVDTVILGCTHYGLLETVIRDVIGSNIKIINESRAVPSRLRDYLNRHPEYKERLSHKGTMRCFTTDLSENFQTIAPQFFNGPISIEKISI